MRTPTFLLTTVGIALTLATGAGAQHQYASTQMATLEIVPVRIVTSVEGCDNFQAHCAQCHGSNARGVGPAGPALKFPAADLTLISVRHGGTFPRSYVWHSIRGNQDPSTAHGMPNWQPVLRSICRNDGELQIRLSNLVSYLESVQRQ